LFRLNGKVEETIEKSRLTMQSSGGQAAASEEMSANIEEMALMVSQLEQIAKKI
jgi:methyl-accepting chemotaxis protein